MEMTTGFLGGWTVGAAEMALSILVRGAVLLVLAFALVLLLRRSRAALRYHVWALATAGLAALPLLVAATPEWRVGVPGTAAIEAVAAALSIGSATDAAPTHGGRSSAGVHRPASVGTGAWRDGGSPAVTDRTWAGGVEDPAAAAAATAATGTAAGTESTPTLSWPQVLLLAWAAGVLLFVGRLLVGLGVAARLVRRAQPVTDARWNVLVSRLSLRARLLSDVRLVSSDEVDVPMAWGIFSSWLVLPKGIEAWPEERRRVVVLHELAHLKRRDCLMQALGRLALAVHWPNPLAWLAARRMRAEREQACDDEVLVAGVGGPAYAHHLVDIARGLSRRVQPARAAVAMARPSELEHRVVAILDDRRNRRGLGPRARRTGLLTLAALLVPVATLRPAPAEVAGGAAAQGDEVHRASSAGMEIVNPAGGDHSTVDDAPTVEDDPSAAGDDALPAARAGGPLGADAGLERRGTRRDQGAVRDRETDGALKRLLPATQTDTIEERVFRALVRALESEDPEVRARIAHTLGTIESPRGVEPLARLIRGDTDAGVRAQAAWALGMIESADGVDALGDGVRDTDDEVRSQSVWALGMIESARGVELLLPLLGEESPEARKQVAWSLGMIEASTAVPGLTDAFAAEDSPEVRSEIVWALGMIEDREAMETLVDALEDPDPGVREKALWAVGMVMN